MQEMKYLKTYRLFESKAGLTKEQEAFLNRYTKGTWSYNPATGLVDVEGDFKCYIKHLMDFKGVRFGKVSGDFNCHTNRLTSLEGAPQEVGGNFSCSTNNLTSLAGAPQEVGGDFNCENNPLTSLEGAPQKVGEDFVCSWNNLTSLAGAPQKVGGYFRCYENKLTSLEGAPQEVGGGFNCKQNNLTSLEGAPQEVDGYFDCSSNNLTSLAGAPQEVGGDFECDAFVLEKEEWNPKGWLKVLREGSPEAQKLIPTIFSAEELNKQIQKDPTGMIMKLKEVWNDDDFKETRSKLVWPKGYGDSAELVGDLDDVGF
jgi:hypothetical protein